MLAAFVAEALLLDPQLYELYAMTWHGFFLGLLAFFLGFCLMFAGKDCWGILLKGRLLFLIISISLFAWRMTQLVQRVPVYQLATESVFWLFSVFAFAFRYLNHPSRLLSYLSQAAYPIYILHMPFLFLGSSLIFPLDIDVQLKFIMVLIFTTAGCLVAMSG